MKMFRGLLIFLVSFFAVLIWVQNFGASKNAPSHAFMQTFIIFFVVWMIPVNKIRWLLFVSVAIIGWVVSFISSVSVESMFNPYFFDSMVEQYKKEVLVGGFFDWFLISIIYLGWLQAIFFLWYRWRIDSISR